MASGSVGRPNGSLGTTTQRSVSPFASNPSQKLLSAKSERRSSARNSSRSRLAHVPRFWHSSVMPGALEPRLEDRVEVLHVAAVREQRQHAAAHREVHALEQRLEVGEVAALVGQRDVGGDEDRHLPLEVVAARQAQRAPVALVEPVEPDAAREVLEALPRRDRRRGEHDAVHARVQVAREHLAHVEPLGDELLGGARRGGGRARRE